MAKYKVLTGLSIPAKAGTWRRAEVGDTVVAKDIPANEIQRLLDQGHIELNAPESEER